MNKKRLIPGATAQQGMILITSLLLLLIVTILAVAMFRGFSVEGRIAGNVREKARALHLAESAEQYAEYWLTQAGNTAGATTACAGLLDANLSQGQICDTTLLAQNIKPQSFPWKLSGADIGTVYLPPPLQGTQSALISVNGAQGSYYDKPRFYIADLGPAADGQGEAYQIDAAAYGASPTSVAVVESTFEVSSSVTCRSCL